MTNSLNSLIGIGPKTSQKLQQLGISQPQHLLYHYPSSYLDFSHFTTISKLKPQQPASLKVKVISFKNIFTRQHRNLQICQVKDKTGQIDLIWFNSPFLSRVIKRGQSLTIAGTPNLYKNKLTIFTPNYGNFNAGQIIPKYPATQGLSSKKIRKIINQNLNQLLKEHKSKLPSPLLKKYKLLPLPQALQQIHQPSNQTKLQQARFRLAVDELLALQSQSYLLKQQWLKNKPSHIFKTNSTIQKQISTFIKNLPFQLTSGQKQAWQQISRDLISTTKTTNRLLVGDVGCGKTIIAVLATFLAHLNHQTSLLLAPTELLAQQHFQTFKNHFKNLNINLHLLTSQSKKSLAKIKPGDIIISTHAILYQQKKLLQQLALVIIDEQHKFGVKQRSAFQSLQHKPHTITMTATPIPRTIALTLLANLDLSIIKTMPKKRLKTKTFVVPKNKIKDCYSWIANQIKQKQTQAFIVCPFVNPSEQMDTVKSATQEFQILSKQVFPKFKLELLHGQIKSQKRQKIIQQFQQNKINILVTTPIIEVGIDIPNANIMIIQSADRFGLAQLHQLRGRIGRGQQQSYCYLFHDSKNESATNRLNFLAKHHLGIEIAEYDLKNRGPGQVFSTLQHGFPSLKLAQLSNTKLIELSKKIMEDIIHNHHNFNLKQLLNPISTSNSTTISPMTN
ncbi:hypothetical protein DRH14_01145 [Candidatus Shapirobacteria bacterium]|nr:MAG: hypothetical protein DRH14_01145 [Candidatus Shapirobacteria bacterium]